jgi:NAD(P)-dependent dehydrogenase (short-subunit alcohol dehydrogenase family)
MTARRSRVLVTGGSSGIGAATVERFLAGGASVANLDRAHFDSRAGAISIAADLADPASALMGVEEAATKLEGLDIVVCCAGIDRHGTVEETTVDDWDHVFAVNLRGVFLCAKAAIPHLRAAGGGVIVIVASQLSFVAQRRSAAYCASKGGALQLARAISLDYAGEGIRACAVCPGPTLTPMFDAQMEQSSDAEAERSMLLAKELHGRFIAPEEIAEAIWYLASPGAASVIGSALVVDGGYVIH